MRWLAKGRRWLSRQDFVVMCSKIMLTVIVLVIFIPLPKPSISSSSNEPNKNASPNDVGAVSCAFANDGNLINFGIIEDQEKAGHWYFIREFKKDPDGCYSLHRGFSVKPGTGQVPVADLANSKFEVIERSRNYSDRPLGVIDPYRDCAATPPAERGIGW